MYFFSDRPPKPLFFKKKNGFHMLIKSSWDCHNYYDNKEKGFGNIKTRKGSLENVVIVVKSKINKKESHF